MNGPLKEQLEQMSIAQWQARQIVQTATVFGDFVLSTREDRLRWKPSCEPASQTRTVMEMVGECVYVNRRTSAVLRGQEPLPRPENYDTFETAAEAVELLNSSAKELAEVVSQLSAEDLAREYPTHRGMLSGAMISLLTVRNMTYHAGQVNMIQLLYGDTEFHVSPAFLTV